MTRRVGFWLATATMASVLSACATATPRPVDPPTYLLRHDAVRLDVLAPQGGWSGVDLLVFAVDHNPKVAEAKARRDAVVATGAAARIAQPITLTLTSEYASERPRWGYGAGLDAPFDVGVRRKARVTDADLKVLQASEDYSETVWSLRSQIEHARITVLSADAEASAWDQVAALRRQRVERFNQRVAAGEDARSDALIARADVATAQGRAVEARRRRDIGRLDLAKGLGAAGTAVRDVVLAPLRPTILPDIVAPRLEAATRRPEILRAIADYDLAENALRLEVARQYPEVRLSPGYMYDHGVTKLPFSLALVLPPLDLNRSAIAAAEAARAAAGRALEVRQAQFLAEVDDAFSAVVAARAAAVRSRDQDVAMADAAAAVVTRAVKLGAQDRGDDLLARALAAEAQITLLRAQEAIALATADLEDALRRPLNLNESQATASLLIAGPSQK